MTLNASRGVRNFNPGNIDRHPGVRWQGQADNQSGDGRFVVFDSAKWGIRAIARVLITYQDRRRAGDGTRIDTIRDIIDRWAPPNENNTGAYAQHVAKLTDIGVNDRIDVYDYSTMFALVTAIITHENGYQPYDKLTIDAGLKLAGIEPKQKPITKKIDVVATASASAVALFGTVAEVIQNNLPQAVQTARTVEPVAPEWIKPLFLALILALLVVALVRQVQLHRAAA